MLTNGSGWVDVIAILQGSVGDESITEDGDECRGDDISPADLPVETQTDIQHKLYVVDESLETVEPAYTNGLNHSLYGQINPN